MNCPYPETQFGHWPYPVLPEAERTPVGLSRSNQREVLVATAMTGPLLGLLDAARRAGVGLVVLSGFRTWEYQQRLFERAIARHGSPAAAAKWVAPPGYSEHHTGFAVDLGDVAAPAADFEAPFEQTAAFAWLHAHAGRHGFELSFPPDNTGGIGYEPWHWRFVGKPEALAVFAAARAHAGGAQPSIAPKAAL